MSDGQFIPRSARRDAETERRFTETLISGVPEHLKMSIYDFIEATTSDDDLAQIEAALRLPVKRERFQGYVRVRATIYQTWKTAGDDWLLDVVDHRLHHLPEIAADDYHEMAYGEALKLQTALRSGGSAYEIVTSGEDADTGQPRLRLEDRVSEEVRTASQEAMSHGKSGDHLRVAWSALYGRSPDPTTAYREAVRAVEVAAAPVVTPTDTQAELGKIVATLRDAPKDKFVVALVGKHESADSVNIVKLMTQLLHTHDHKRHGDPDPDKPIGVSPEEGAAALHLAVLLVQWFETGAIK